MSPLRERLGEFTIPFDIVENHPEAVGALLAGMTILDAGFDHSCRGIRYRAWHPSFAVRASFLSDTPRYELKEARETFWNRLRGEEQYRLSGLSICGANGETLASTAIQWPEPVSEAA